MEIREDRVTGPEMLALLNEHLRHMRAVTPPESVHALDVAGLRAPAVMVWSAWDGDVLLGCGALKALDESSGEVKSMRTAEAHRGSGVGSALLAHIERVAAARGYRRLYVETGSRSAFAAARAFYTRHGYVPCGPFAEYGDDPHSAFFVKAL